LYSKLRIIIKEMSINRNRYKGKMFSVQILLMILDHELSKSDKLDTLNMKLFL
jgi:hypothetical protein